MRNSDLIRLALEKLKGKWTILPVIGFVIASFCLCFAGAVFWAVQEEKAQPYEIISSAQNALLSDENVAEIIKIEDVSAASPVMQIPVSISTGDYMAQLMLTGIDEAHLEEGFLQGGVYPNNSVMPYIVLNQAACKQFAAEKNKKDINTQDKEMPEIDWLNQSFSVQLGEGIKSVTSKVCGILSADEEEMEAQEPTGYISLSTAKSLLQQSRQSTDYSAIYVRVKNIGCTRSVSKELAKIGLMVSNSTDMLQAGWDADTKEMTYLIVVGVFSMLCASVLLGAWRTVSSLKQKAAWEAMQYLGMQVRSIRKMYVFQTLLLALTGITIGVLAAVVLPSFLTAEAAETNFMLQIPFMVAVVNIVICIVFGLVPSWFIPGEKGS